jgi:hypothetical protein
MLSSDIVKDSFRRSPQLGKHYNADRRPAFPQAHQPHTLSHSQSASQLKCRICRTREVRAQRRAIFTAAVTKQESQAAGMELMQNKHAANMHTSEANRAVCLGLSFTGEVDEREKHKVFDEVVIRVRYASKGQLHDCELCGP